ncbi:hypothetical protein GCM10020295_61770 [Streptomyces cinereospinus]
MTALRRPPVGEDGDASRYERTSRLESPPPPAAPRRRSRQPRTVGTVVAAVLLALGLGVGVWYINSGQFTEVPPLLAKTESQAEDRLADAGLEVGQVEHAHSDTVKRGTIISTDPAPGARIRHNDSVSLTVSDGPETVQVPDLAGYRLDKARSVLEDSGLEPGMVTRAFSEDISRGSVIGTDPGTGTTTRAGTAIALTVSKGAPVDVPDVTGRGPDEARQRLQEAGLTVRIAAQRINSELDAGQVARQSPGPDGRAAEGDTVTLTLSQGPRMVEVPDVVGDSADEAGQRLEDAGFAVEEDRGLLGLFGDTVREQSVEGGETAPEGSTITIEIR